MKTRPMPPILKPGAYRHTICAWCRKRIGRDHDITAKEDYTSHGICRRCAALHFGHIRP
jgi:hypothetical protein